MSKSDRYQRQVLELVKQPGNDVCADCRARNPRWASWDQGVFICVNCATLHRKLGTHISKVKSLTLDTWSKEQVDHMRQKGNVRVNALLNPGDVPPPTTIDITERNSQLERFIRSKYEHKQLSQAAPKPPPLDSSPQRPRAHTIATATADSTDSSSVTNKQVRFSGAAVDIDDEQPLRSPIRSRSPSKSILRPRSATNTPEPSMPSIVVNAQPVTALPQKTANGTNPFLSLSHASSSSSSPSLQPLRPNHTGVQGSLSSMRAMQDSLPLRHNNSLPPSPGSISLPPSGASPATSPLASPGVSSVHQNGSWLPSQQASTAVAPTPTRGFVPSSSFGQQLAAELSMPSHSNPSSLPGTPSPAPQAHIHDPYAALSAFGDDTSSPFAVPRQPSPQPHEQHFQHNQQQQQYQQYQQQQLQPQRTGYNPFLAMQQTGPAQQPHRAMSLPPSLPSTMAQSLPVQQQYGMNGGMTMAQHTQMQMHHPMMTGNVNPYGVGVGVGVVQPQQQQQQYQYAMQTNPFLRMQQQQQQQHSYGYQN